MMNYLPSSRASRTQLFDTEHPTLDAAISKTTELLNAAQYAWLDYDHKTEKCARLRARLEAGRAPKYGNPLGVKVDSSGGGEGSGFEDKMIELIELEKELPDCKAKLTAACNDVRSLINRACRPNSRQAVALEANYLSFPPITYDAIAERYPAYFKHGKAAMWAVTQGETAVAQLILDEMRESARAKRVLPA